MMIAPAPAVVIVIVVVLVLVVVTTVHAHGVFIQQLNAHVTQHYSAAVCVGEVCRLTAAGQRDVPHHGPHLAPAQRSLQQAAGTISRMCHDSK